MTEKHLREIIKISEENDGKYCVSIEKAPAGLILSPYKPLKNKDGTNYHGIDDNAMYGEQTTSGGILIDTSGTNKKLITIKPFRNTVNRHKMTRQIAKNGFYKRKFTSNTIAVIDGKCMDILI